MNRGDLSIEEAEQALEEFKQRLQRAHDETPREPQQEAPPKVEREKPEPAEPERVDPGIFAIWNPPSAAEPEGLVQLNVDHPVFLEEIRHWAPQYPTHFEDEVIKVLKDAYAQLAVATIVHSEWLKPHLERRDKLDQLRSPEALTAALLGLVGPTAVIGPMLGGALGRRRKGTASA